MVNKFPWEVKVAEFGLARDLTRMASRRSSRWRNPRVRSQYAHTASFSHSPRTAEQLCSTFSNSLILFVDDHVLRSCLIPSENPK